MSRYDSMSFEQLLEELESLTRQMAAGDIGIEEAAELYERAGVLHAMAAERLDRVQARIEHLTAQPEGAQPDGAQGRLP